MSFTVTETYIAFTKVVVTRAGRPELVAFESGRKESFDCTQKWVIVIRQNNSLIREPSLLAVIARTSHGLIHDIKSRNFKMAANVARRITSQFLSFPGKTRKIPILFQGSLVRWMSSRYDIFK